jgi:hypothetical protein
MGVIKAIFRTLIGVMFGVGSYLALVPAFAAFMERHSDVVLCSVILISAVLGLFAPTIRRAFGRGFLLVGASVFALPLSTMLLSGRVMQDVVDKAGSGNEGMAAVGAGIAGTLATGAAAFVGFFLGAILIVIGLVLALGGRREVIIVQRG